jgi:hypothetical protein
MRPAIGGPVVGTADDTIGAALRLAAGELAVDELADGVLAEHAATDRPAAQLARTSAVERYLFIAFLYSVQQSQVPSLNASTGKRARFDREPGLTCA